MRRLFYLPMKAVVLALLLAPLHSFAQSCEPRFTPAEKVKLNRGKSLIVTHASSNWDKSRSSQAGMNAAVAYGKSRGYQIVYLQDTAPSSPSTYLYEDCDPDYFVASKAGEFSFRVPDTDVISLGGFMEACHENSVNQIFTDWGKQKLANRRVTFPLNAIYFWSSNHANEEIDDELPPFRPSPGPQTMTILEAFSRLTGITEKINFLLWEISQYTELEPLKTKYNIKMTYKGHERILAKPRRQAPTLELKFVDSLKP